MNWRERAAEDIDISVVINGVEAGAIRTCISEDAFAAFEFLSELSNARGIELPNRHACDLWRFERHSRR